jgi:hypothetical protein
VDKPEGLANYLARAARRGGSARSDGRSEKPGGLSEARFGSCGEKHCAYRGLVSRAVSSANLAAGQQGRRNLPGGPAENEHGEHGGGEKRSNINVLTPPHFSFKLALAQISET